MEPLTHERRLHKTHKHYQNLRHHSKRERERKREKVSMFFTHQILGLIFFFKFQLLIILDILTVGFPLFVPLLSITWDLVFPLKSGHKKTFLEWWVSYALTPSQWRKSIEKIIINNQQLKLKNKMRPKISWVKNIPCRGGW